MVEIVPFSREHSEDAAAIFTATYNRLWKHLPYLREDWRTPEPVAKKLTDICEGNPGVAAIENGKLVAYMAGFSRIEHFKGLSTGVYSPEWGHGCAPGVSEESVFYLMHSELTRGWVESGVFTHAISLLPGSVVVGEYLYQNGYGMVVIDAVRGIGADDIVDQLPAGVVIEEITEGHLEAIRRIDIELWEYLSHEPVFLYSGVRKTTGLSDYASADTNTVVASVDGNVVGAIRASLSKSDCCDIAQGDGTMGINLAFVKPQQRGAGIAAALLARLLAWGASKGSTSCSVDFESANLLGRKFWLKYFQLVANSVIRHIDPRISR